MHAFPIVDFFTIISTFSFSSIIHICEVSVDESGISPAPKLFWNVVNNEYELHDPFGQLKLYIVLVSFRQRRPEGNSPKVDNPNV